jgi:drug/metabolite transporter (DMT)-like permease
VLERLAPALFVLIWSTGWIVAKYVVVARADPLSFLALRYATAGVVITLFALAVGAEWPKRRNDWLHAIVSGILLHAVYLGGVWWAIGAGLPAGLSALIAALQPLLTILIARFLLGEKVTPGNALGVAIGLAGVLAVLSPRLAGVESGALARFAAPVTVNVIAMIGVTAGTFYQKRFVASGDLRSLTAVQYLGALIVTLPLAYALEPMQIPLTRETAYALAWSVLVLSIGAIALMLMMIRRGAVSRVASLIYLIPPTAAVQAFVMFDETLSLVQIAGMGVTAIGVYLATRK